MLWQMKILNVKKKAVLCSKMLNESSLVIAFSAMTFLLSVWILLTHVDSYWALCNLLRDKWFSVWPMRSSKKKYKDLMWILIFFFSLLESACCLEIVLRLEISSRRFGQIQKKRKSPEQRRIYFECSHLNYS